MKHKDKFQNRKIEELYGLSKISAEDALKDACLLTVFVPAQSQTVLRRLHRLWFSFALTLMMLVLLFSLSACSSQSPSDSSKNSVSAESESDTYQAPSLDDFKAAASAYGTVTDMTQQLTYESAAVQNNSRYNIIYMKAVTPDQAERILFSESGFDAENASENPNIQTLRSGGNYCYYEEYASTDPQSNTAAFYGRYLRIDNVLLIVTGAPEDKAGVQGISEKLFQSLGYDPQ